MKYRQLGTTGLVVSEIGFGGWGIGGISNGAVAYGPTDDRESTDALQRAFDLGINFYDTSDVYGYGHSEALIGAAFKRVRTKVTIASKVGFLKADGPQDFSPRHIRTAIEQSLRRLQTDYVDLYQLHSPQIMLLERDEGVLHTLDSLKKEGKIRVLGISVRSPDDGLTAIKTFGFKCVQVNFSLVDQRAVENELMELCKVKNVGLICRTPLCFGFLSGKYSVESIFDVGDHRGTWPREQIAIWANAHRIFSYAVTDEHQTCVQFALRFCLSYPVATVIPGMMNGEQVEESAAASQLETLTEETLRKLHDIYQMHTFFLGKG